MAAVLAHAEARSKLVHQVAEYVQRNNFRGVTVDLISDLPRTARRVFTLFLKDLAARLRPEGRKVIALISGGVIDDRLSEIGEASDYVLLATHNQILERPGPIAAQGWFEDQLARIASKLDHRKLIVSIGSFGYEWNAYGAQRRLSVQAAWELMAAAAAAVKFDGRALNPRFSYVSDDGVRRDVWFLDGLTAYNQVKAALAIQVSGIAIWRLGLEDPGVWASAGRNRTPDETALKMLRRLEPGRDAYSRAKGVLLSAAPGSDGWRELTINRRLGLIVDETVVSVPRQVNITTWGAVDPKLVALTFDDGPDPVYTPQVLDVLARKGVKATFYVTGRAAIRSPDILRRIYEEGHEIGHHSFSHEDLSNTSSNRVQFELNSVQRILESEVGIRSILFRPPYAHTGFGYLNESPHVAETASRLGYLIANLDVDGLDWFAPAPAIARQVIRQVADGLGQVVLLHDAGGNRRGTVEALPSIIDELTAKGFRFGTTSELVGRAKHEFLPLQGGEGFVERAQSGIRLASFDLVRWMGDTLPPVAIAASVLGVARLWLVVGGAFVHARRRRRAKAPRWLPDQIVVLVPAYNEEKVICKTLQTLLASTVSERLEIIVIDDGSSDKTAEVVKEEFSGTRRVRICTKENGGKAAALNYGIAQSSAEVAVAIDADTVVLPDAIERLVGHFGDPAIGAVAGKVVVGNPVNLLTRFQSLEYITSQNLDRRAFELFNAIGVVPGAVGAWRRQALVEAGGYSHDTLAEDADLTLTLQRYGWKVIAEPGAIALTEAPETLRAFLKQRFRWMFGTLQVGAKHLSALVRRPCGVSLLTIPNVFLFQFGFTLLSPVMDLLLIWTLFVDALHGETLLRIAAYWALFQAVDAVAAATGICLDGNRSAWRLLPLIVLQRFSYRQLLYVVAIRALLTAIKGRLVAWGKLVRTGSVKSTLQPASG
jgi:cellulose synthase/poly-beta-1,6-N-acetylglucosamine synthase-like glycosyltransferase/peptidoglycan/xylan/chitin deacetylase (PgdA/CDA1 family)